MQRQGQLHTAGPGTDERDHGTARVVAHALDQRAPVGVEAVDRLDGHDVVGGTAHPVHLRRGADIDREAVVGDRRAIAAQHLARLAVDTDGLVVEVARARKGGEPAQVDVDVVVVVMAGDVAGQHPGVGGVRVAADQGEPDAGDGLHAEALEHADVAVAPADEHDIPEDRLFRLLHPVTSIGR